MTSSETSDPGPAKIKASTIFWLCFKIGLTSFGGGLSGWFHRELVVKRKWISDEDFISSFALSQMLPGGTIVNLLITIGHQLLGVRGILAGIFGLILGPFFFVIAVAALIDHYSGNIAGFDSISQGVAFAAVGLMVLLCFHGLKRSWAMPERLGVIVVTVLGVAVMRWPLPLVVLAVAPFSVFFALKRL